MAKAITRDRVVSVKMSDATYQQFKQVAKSLDLMTSTAAYLIIRKFLAEHDDPAAKPSDFNLL